MTSVLTLRPPVDDPAALAALVAHPTDPRPFLLDRHNRHAGELPDLPAALAHGGAFVLTVSPDVLVWDADTSEQAEAADALAAELAAEGWPVLRTASGRADHRHLWTVAPDPLDRGALAARADARGLPAPRTAMRPPGAPHRHGLPVAVLDDPAEFSRAVAAARAAHVHRAALDPAARLDWRDLLSTGRFPAGWAGEGSPSTMVWHVCIGAHRAGLGIDAVRRLVADPANRGGLAYRQRLNLRGKSHADHWLDRYVWPKATEAADRRPEPPADAAAARERLDAITEAIESYRWVGQAGATDRAVLLAIVRRCYERGTLTPTMSHRELAEAAPCHRNTVRAATARLVAAGWLQTVERGRGRTVTEAGEHRERADATRWRLRMPALVVARLCATGGTPPASTSLSGTSSRAALDVCRWRGLGLNAPRVLDALAAGPLDARELADLLNLNRGNLRARLLPRLAAHGLIVRAGARWRVADDLERALTGAADALELTGKADDVAARHAAERAGYLEHRDRTRPAREAAREARRRAAVAAAVAARRPTGTDAQLWPDRPPEATPEPLEALGLPPPSPTPVEAAQAPLVLAGGGGRER